VTSPAEADGTLVELPAVRPPQQRRTRERWQRVLDAGVSLLEERGYEAFTIAAVCERAQVVPRFIYARVDNKEALFLAVYEYGITRVNRAAGVFANDRQWHDLPPDQVVQKAVREVIGLFQRQEAFIRSVVRISGVHKEVNRRGARYSQELGDAFTRRLLDIRDQIDDPDPETAIRVAYNAVFSAVIFRVAYGPAFAVPPLDDQTFSDTLTTMVQRYLFSPSGPGARRAGRPGC
jgi:AcrR family transcriptional regulator